jgi:hypothetical protein
MFLTSPRPYADLSYPDHPALSIQVSSDARLADSEDGSFLNITVRNHLPCVRALAGLDVACKLTIDRMCLLTKSALS